jgi:hypothetical protein
MRELSADQNDEVVDYILDRLTSADRRKFELRLDGDKEFREFVREMEQSIVAIAEASPIYEAPPKVWPRIETTLGRQVRNENWLSLFQLGWIFNSRALAGVAMTVIIVQWFWFHFSVPTQSGEFLVANGRFVAKPEPKPMEPEKISSQTPAESRDKVTVQEATEELTKRAALLARIASLENQLARVTATAQQATSKVATPALASTHSIQLSLPVGFQRGAKNLAPEVQQALLLAVAREMGWTYNLPVSDSNQDSTTNQMALDYVDLNSSNSNAKYISNPTETTATESINSHPGSSILPTNGGFDGHLGSPIMPPTTDTSTGNTPDPATGNAIIDGTQNNSNNSDNSAAVLSLGNKIIAVINPASLQNGQSPVTIWQMDNDGNGQIIGTFRMGSNPTVITFGSEPGQNYLMTVDGTNILAQFPPSN